MSKFFMVVLAKRLSSILGFRKYQKTIWSVSRIIEPNNIPKNVAIMCEFGDLITIKKNATKKNKIEDANRW